MLAQILVAIMTVAVAGHGGRGPCQDREPRTRRGNTMGGGMRYGRGPSAALAVTAQECPSGSPSGQAYPLPDMMSA